MLSRVVRGEVVGVMMPVEVPELSPPYACSALFLRFVLGEVRRQEIGYSLKICFRLVNFLLLFPSLFLGERSQGARRWLVVGWGWGGGGVAHAMNWQTEKKMQR